MKPFTANDAAFEDLSIDRHEACILEGSDETFSCLIFCIPAGLMQRIEEIAGGDAFLCQSHQAMVLNHLLELGTKAKETELAAEAGQERLF